MIINPPCIVSIVGCSFITIHTQKGPIMVSNKKNKFTSSAGINLGAIVTKTNGIATQIMHIKGTINKSWSAKTHDSKIKNRKNSDK